VAHVAVHGVALYKVTHVCLRAQRGGGGPVYGLRGAAQLRTARWAAGVAANAGLLQVPQTLLAHELAVQADCGPATCMCTDAWFLPAQGAAACLAQSAVLA
jgi:hypothetical protein